MPSLRHDTLNGLFRDRPELAAEVLNDYAGGGIPAGLPAQVVSNELNDRNSKDFYPDTVITLGSRQHPHHVIVVEIQQETTDGKRSALPRYAAALWLAFDRPVTVLVICPSRKATDYFAQPIATALPGYTLTPRALGPDQIPQITDPAQVIANPELATLSVAVHGTEPSVAKAFMEAMPHLPTDDAPYYYEYAYSLATKSIQTSLENFMKTAPWPVYSPFAKEHFGRGKAEGREEGKAEGKAEGEAHAILAFLRARGLAVGPEAEARITGCADLHTLDRWLRLAATVTSTDDLFDTAP